MAETSPHWSPAPEQIAAAQMTDFMREAAGGAGRSFADYEDLRAWSVEDPAAFWGLFWKRAGMVASAPWERVVDDPARMPGARWFPGARLNFAENLLRYRDERPALIFQCEDRPPRELSYRELFARAARFANALRRAGVGPGDCVAGFMPNMPETVIAMLGAVSVGAVWTSCSPDFGAQGALDRFGQVRPRVLVASDGYRFKGRLLSITDKLVEIAAGLPQLERLVLVPFDDPAAGAPESLADCRAIQGLVSFADFIAGESETAEFYQAPFDHPVYIMYSSGTTGLPKCMVQGPGVLLNHLKEHILHCDLRAGERIFYYTTCGWMMWNWLVSALAVGATLVLYDGSPFAPDAGVLWRMAEQFKINVFGTSARYISALEEAGARPASEFDLSALRLMLSTGSPLAPESYDYVHRDIKADLQLSSISGGTDLNGCFALGNPILPVYRGELQCRGLGMAVEIFDDAGRSVKGEQGELVCTRAFPSMPLYFWNDPDGRLYHKAYFDVYPGVWRHGDFAELTERGGLIVYGRSDATLNPGGVRIGTAEIYRVVEALPEIEDSVCVGQDFQGDVRVLLFVKLKAGARLTEELTASIRRRIRDEVSPRHVPALVLSTPEIPYTRNMKKIEVAVKRVIDNQPVTNREALANPEALEHFRDRPELR